jgi:hypothetical protein
MSTEDLESGEHRHDEIKTNLGSRSFRYPYHFPAPSIEPDTIRDEEAIGAINDTWEDDCQRFGQIDHMSTSNEFDNFCHKGGLGEVQVSESGNLSQFCPQSGVSYFEKLPLELKAAIRHASIEPRIIEILQEEQEETEDDGRGGCFTVGNSCRRIPSILHVCRSFRQAAKQIYSPIPALGLYVALHIDTLYFPGSIDSLVSLVDSLPTEDLIRHVHRLAFPQRFMGNPGDFIQVLLALPCTEYLTVVIADDCETVHSSRSPQYLRLLNPPYEFSNYGRMAAESYIRRLHISRWQVGKHICKDGFAVNEAGEAILDMEDESLNDARLDAKDVCERAWVKELVGKITWPQLATIEEECIRNDIHLAARNEEDDELKEMIKALRTPKVRFAVVKRKEADSGR